MNRLATQTSPYLLQHAYNPVDWYPWGPEALARARAEDKPICLSIGYSACHWCHVMERESFENDETARLMNELFICIKVDREERPDIDAIYMSAVQAMTGQGGWPLTIFLTPDGAPYLGGTYFPPEDRHGMPSFRRVLRVAADAYQNRRADIERATSQVRELYAHAQQPAESTGALEPQLLERAWRGIAQRYDPRHGGFNGAPKFPQAMALDYLLRTSYRTENESVLDMARTSFRSMARGGIYDQIGGGFHRYSVDDRWLVPHFEKMLYDNALLVQLGCRLFLVTRDGETRRVIEETVDWVSREMTDATGGFYSSLDADSEGEEGRFYVWSAQELTVTLRDDATAAAAYWGVTPGGNFEGHNILHVPNEPAVVASRLHISLEELEGVVARSRAALGGVRAQRVRPARDEKILASWNGLMLRAVAECARSLGRGDYLELARRNGEFLFRELVRDNRVLRTYTAGTAQIAGYLEDHAAVALGALALYEATFDPVWIERARGLAQAIVRWFWDENTRMFFDTASDQEALITRPREVTDNATPSGSSLAVELLLRVGAVGDDPALGERARWVLETLAEPMARWAPAFGHLLGAADLAIRGALEVAIVGDPSREDFQHLAHAVSSRYLPALIMAGGMGEQANGIALLAQRPMRQGLATAYVCRRSVCGEPVTDPSGLLAQLTDPRTS